MTIRWSPIAGFPGYEVSTTGEVWSTWRKNGRNPALLTSERRRRLSPGVAGSNGYEQVWLFRDGQRHGRFVHVLVLEAFVGSCPEGLQARHRNGHELDNRVENLTWGTALENAADRDDHGRTCRGEAVATARLTTEQVRAIRASGESVHALARTYGVSRRQVGRILRREAWAAA